MAGTPQSDSPRGRCGESSFVVTGYDSTTIPTDLRELPLFDKLGAMGDLAEMIAGVAHPV